MAPKRKVPDAAAATPAGKRAKGEEETPPKAAPAGQEAVQKPASGAAFGKSVKSGELELSLDSPDSGQGGKAAGKAKAKAKGKAAAKAKAKATADSQEAEAEAGGARGDGPMKPKEIAALIEASAPYSASLRPAPAERVALKVLSWNVNGLNALLKARPDALRELVAAEQPDVVMLQETKLQAKDVDDVKGRCLPEGWASAWACSAKTLGYSGVAALWRPGLEASVSEGLGVEEADREGRCLTLETPDHFVVGCYAPNAGEGLKRLEFRVGQWEPAIAAHVRKLQEKKPVVYCGDLNVCHKELDLWGNHSPNAKQAGYTPQERQAMKELLEGCELVDSFRQRHPDVRAFSYWSFRFNGRAKNNGWRLDYCLVSKALAERTHDAFVLPDVMGSDHCPVGITLI